MFVLPHQSLNRELTTTDLARFDFYAPLVKQLVVSHPCSAHPNVSPDVWPIFARVRGGRLPNLHSITLSEHFDGCRSMSTCVPVLLGPASQLRELCLYLEWQHKVYAPNVLKSPFSDLVGSLPRTCPMLGKLKLTVGDPKSSPQYRADILAGAVCGLPQLVSLEVTGIPFPACTFARIRTSPILSTLTIDVRATDHSQRAYVADASPEDDAFPSLSTLMLSSESM
ncbi:hypothetical protein FKP32DRAFT_137841 [Trametes sanguinea]|nr:hypothetical protein FKP32DRAFT_137841 [Trametes sanguinea]